LGANELCDPNVFSGDFADARIASTQFAIRPFDAGR